MVTVQFRRQLTRQQHQRLNCYVTCAVITGPICYVCRNCKMYDVNAWKWHTLFNVAHIKWKINCLNFRQYYWIRWDAFCQRTLCYSFLLFSKSKLCLNNSIFSCLFWMNVACAHVVQMSKISFSFITWRLIC